MSNAQTAVLGGVYQVTPVPGTAQRATAKPKSISKIFVYNADINQSYVIDW
jgi:hypothetical protein